MFVTPRYIFWRFLFWPQFAGVLSFLIALFSARRRLSFRLEQLPIFGGVFVSASLAVFGAEHLVSANFIMQMVPPWMPARLFWAYFVGFALVAASTSIALRKHVRLSASLLALMLLLFVCSMHLPHLAADPRDRFRWAVALRDLVFALGAWALAETQGRKRHERQTDGLLVTCRVVFALVLVYFGIEHWLHPDFAPGVPLEQRTPAWVPARSLCGYIVGAILLINGFSILTNRHARTAATLLGVAITVVVLFIYVPMLVVAMQPSEVNNAVNYIADTTLFAGSIFLLAAAIPVGSRSASSVRQAEHAGNSGS
jgi:uncharacterized membrane protein